MIFGGSLMVGGGGGPQQSVRGFRNVRPMPQVSHQSSQYPEIVTHDAENPTYVTPFGSYSGKPQSNGNLALFMPGWFSMPNLWRPYAAVGETNYNQIRMIGQELWINRQGLKPVPVGKLRGPQPGFVLPNTLLAQPLPKKQRYLGQPVGS